MTTTSWGRITLTVHCAAETPEQLILDIVDTGHGLSVDEQANADFPFQGQTQQDRFGQASGMALFLSKQLCQQLGGKLEIHACQDIGSRYHIQLPATIERHQEQEEKLLDGVTVLLDITGADVQKIVEHQLGNWGADYVTPDERFSGQEHDLLITDDPAHLAGWSLLVTHDEPNVVLLAPGQYRASFNISHAMQDALLGLIEQQLSQDETVVENRDPQEVASLFNSGYFQLFVDTVPDDVRRLYSEATNREYSALAQTAHRLKGVFAMLNLHPGKQLCEALEQHIHESHDLNIKNTTSELDQYVSELLLQGKPSNE